MFKVKQIIFWGEPQVSTGKARCTQWIHCQWYVDVCGTLMSMCFLVLTIAGLRSFAVLGLLSAGRSLKRIAVVCAESANLVH